MVVYMNMYDELIYDRICSYSISNPYMKLHMLANMLIYGSHIWKTCTHHTQFSIHRMLSYANNVLSNTYHTDWHTCTSHAVWHIVVWHLYAVQQKCWAILQIYLSISINHQTALSIANADYNCVQQNKSNNIDCWI